MNFKDQYHHPQWQKRRLEILQLSGFECENCGSAEKTLHVHHKYYKKNKMIWDYPDHAFSCICEDCHKEEHYLKDQINIIFGFLTNYSKQCVIGYAAAQSDPIFKIHKLSTPEIEGMSDHFRISSRDLCEFISNKESVDLLDIFNFARNKFDSDKCFQARSK